MKGLVRCLKAGSCLRDEWGLEKKKATSPATDGMVRAKGVLGSRERERENESSKYRQRQ